MLTIATFLAIHVDQVGWSYCCLHLSTTIATPDVDVVSMGSIITQHLFYIHPENFCYYYIYCNLPYYLIH